MSSNLGEFSANERPQPLDARRGGAGAGFKSIMLTDAFTYQNRRGGDARQTLSTIDEEDSEETDSDLSLIGACVFCCFLFVTFERRYS